MLEVTVKEKDDQGHGTLVEMFVDAKIRKVRYLCRYNWDMPGGGIGWDYVSGDLKDNQGRYTFVERGTVRPTSPSTSSSRSGSSCRGR